MSDDKDLRTRRASRFPKRERVTLKWDSPPLLLPGEKERDPAQADEGALELPKEDSAEDGARISSIPPPGESPIGEDAWERQKPKLTPAPFRPPTEPPPPMVDNEDGDALDLVERRSRSSSPSLDLTSEMGDRHALGDYTAALRIAELILGREPEHDLAQRIAESCRERLGQLYGSRLGSLERVPYVAVQMHEVRWLGLDHRAAFLLSRIDGSQTIFEILDVSGMPKLEALKMLVELLDMGAIGFRD